MKSVSLIYTRYFLIETYWIFSSVFLYKNIACENRQCKSGLTIFQVFIERKKLWAKNNVNYGLSSTNCHFFRNTLFVWWLFYIRPSLLFHQQNTWLSYFWISKHAVQSYYFEHNYIDWLSVCVCVCVCLTSDHHPFAVYFKARHVTGALIMTYSRTLLQTFYEVILYT